MGLDHTLDVDAEAIVFQICQAPIRGEHLMYVDDGDCTDTVIISAITGRLRREVEISIHTNVKKHACQRHFDPAFAISWEQEAEEAQNPV